VANLAVSYEQLRGRVLAGQPDGWRLGHGLLVGKGMVAWLGACTTFESAPVTGTAVPELSITPSTVPPSTPTPHPPTALPSRPSLPSLPSLPYAGQLVAVLTQMALAHA